MRILVSFSDFGFVMEGILKYLRTSRKILRLMEGHLIAL
jgi:hypothetical protein